MKVQYKKHEPSITSVYYMLTTGKRLTNSVFRAYYRK